jgi:DNA-binding CsgD family transcriptional regulator
MSESIKLTKRQEAVLSWLQKGAPNKHIAKQLGISISTVKLHVGAVLKKYGCRDRLALTLSSLSGKPIEPPVQLPSDVEPKPYGWELRRGKKVVAVSFEDTPPSSEW